MDFRNLDQIQERERFRAGGAFWPWLLGAVSVGALGLTAATWMPRTSSADDQSPDPLAELVARAQRSAETDPPPDELRPDNASFSEILSDREPPSVALVAVKSADGRLVEQTPTRPAPPPPGDELPVVPLPAGELLSSTRVTSEPADGLTQLAADRATVPAHAEPARPGRAGKYQIQVASFREKREADAYAERLRERGHSAYAQAARVPGRGLWHRVRIGPFESRFETLNYQQAFERKENMATFLVDPAKVERQRARRAAKLAARARQKARISAAER